MTVKRTQPRTPGASLEASGAFSIALADRIIAAVCPIPVIDEDLVPEDLKDEGRDNLAVKMLARELGNLARNMGWNEHQKYSHDPAEVRMKARKIAELCQQLSEELLDERGKVVGGLGEDYLFSFAALDGEADGATRVLAIAQDIGRLKGWAIQAAERAAALDAQSPAKNGRPQDQTLHDLLEHLGEIYFRLWKDPPGRSIDHRTGRISGPYFRFAKAVIEVLLPDWAAEQEIDGPITAAIAHHKWSTRLRL